VIEEVHKGLPLGPTASVFGSNQESACGIHFVQGARYTVYASPSDEGLVTNSCSGTHAGSLDDRSAVAMHPPPLAVRRPATVDDDAPLSMGVAVAGLTAGVAAVVFRRRAG
jgi:hypothetical protein